MDRNFLLKKSNQLRLEVLEIAKKTGVGHIASAFSCAEILTALYYGGVLNFRSDNPTWEKRDRFLLSKGHACSIFYCLLADLGYFPKETLLSMAQAGSMFGVHLQCNVPGAEISSGSLGMGFGIGNGIALAAKLNRETYMTFVLMGDGECYEGSVWESAYFSAHHKLNNLVVIIDNNHMCATDFIESVLQMEPLDKKFEAFGFNVKRIDGHNPLELIEALKGIRCRKSSRPLAIIADTVKAKGLKDVENTLLSHTYSPGPQKIDDDIKRIKVLYEESC